MMRWLLIFSLIAFSVPVLSLAQTELDSPIVLVQENSSSVHSANPTSALENEDFVIEVPNEEKDSDQKSSTYLKGITKLSEFLPKKLQSLFDKLHVPTKFSHFITEDIKAKLEQSKPLIQKSNAQGTAVRIYAAAGLGISELIVNSLRKMKFGNLIPLKGRFGIALGGGVAILKTNQDGKNKIIIRFFADVEKVDRVISWLFEGFAGGTISKISDKVEGKIKLFEKAVMTRTGLGVAGQLSLGKNYFEHALGGGMGFPPFIGYTYIVENKVQQFRINIVYTSGWFRKVLSSIKNSCRSFF